MRLKRPDRKRKIYKILGSQLVDTVGLVGWWKLDGSAFDYSLNNHPGTLKGTLPTYKYPGIDLPGTDEYIEVADHADFTFGNGTTDSPLTISAWIYMDSAADFVIANKVATINEEWRFDFSSASKIYFYVIKLAGNDYQGRYYNTALSASQWYHLAATYDGGGGVTAHDGIKIYINAVRKDDTDSNGGTYTAMDDGTAPVWIGRYSTNYSNGKMGDVMIYNVEKTAAQMKSLYDQTRSKYSV